MPDPQEGAIPRSAADIKFFLYLFGIFYFFFLLLTPMSPDISFAPARQEPPGVYHVLKIDAGDDAGYFAYLKSLFIDHDIDFFNEDYYAHRNKVLDTGYVFNQWNIGPGILWLPFYLAAHVVTKIYNLAGVFLPQDGLSFVYLSSTALGSATYVFLGLILHFLILRRFVSQWTALAVVTLFFLATPLVYFTFIRSRMAHAGDYFLSCLFLYTWLDSRETPTRIQSVFLGLVGGFLILTRINSVCFLLLPVYDMVARYYRNVRGEQKWDTAQLGNFLLMAAGVGLVYSTQFTIHSILAGAGELDGRSGRLVSMLTTPAHWNTILTNPFRILLGPNWGLLWHAPIYILSAFGFVRFAKKHKHTAMPFLAALSVPLFLVLIWHTHGMSYGYRHLLTTNLFLSFGAAMVFEDFNIKTRKTVLITGSVLLVGWSYIQLCFYKILIPYDTTQFVLQAAKSLSILLKIPGLLVRGDNLLYFWLHPDFEINTYLDQYLLLWFPLGQFLIPLILLFTGLYICDKIRRYPGLKGTALIAVSIIMVLFFLGLNGFIGAVSDNKPAEFIAERKAEAARRIATGQ